MTDAVQIDPLRERSRSIWRVVPAIFIGLPAGAAFGLFSLRDPLLYPHGMIAIWMLAGFWALSGAYRPYSVLWLRRFHDNVQRRVPLLRATNGLACVATLRDTVVRSAFGQSVQENWIVWMLVVLGFPLIVGGFTGAGLLAAQMLSVGPLAGAAAGLVVGSVIYGFVLRGLFFRLGFKTLSPAKREDALKSFFYAVENRRAPSGLKIFETSDATWREDVALCLDLCDAVLLDVTDLSEHVIWEARAAYAARPADEIVLCHAVATVEEGGEGLAADKSNALDAALPEGAFRASAAFRYHSGWRGPAQRQASAVIAAAIARGHARRAAVRMARFKQQCADLFKSRSTVTNGAHVQQGEGGRA